MKAKEKCDTSSRRFHERFERISRRRFLRLAALGGAASVGAAGLGPAMAHAQSQQASAAALQNLLQEGYRCRNTRNLLYDNTVNEVFKTKPIRQLLEEGIQSRRFDGEDHLKELVHAVISNLEEEDTYLRDYFIYDKTVDNPGLAEALFNAKFEAFSIPFANSDLDRIAARNLLSDGPDGHGAPFLEAFGNQYLGRFLDKTRNKIGASDEELLRKAHNAGFFRSATKDEYHILGVDECAYKENGIWKCRTSPGDKCDIVDNSPTASTNTCP